MGAGESTAASCSSLDLTNNATARNKYDRYYHNRHQQYVHEQKLLVHQSKRPSNRYSREPHRLTNSNLKQASSHLDLRSDSLIGDRDYFIKSNSPIVAHEAYKLTNADMMYGVPQSPHSAVAMVGRALLIPPGIHGGAKKSNAGVASRILQQRQQQQRSCELKKFSDSLPSLSNIIIPSRNEPAHHQHHQSHIATSNKCHILNMINDPQEHYAGQISGGAHRHAIYNRHSNHLAPSSIQQKTNIQHKQRIATSTNLVMNKTNDSYTDRAWLPNHYDDSVDSSRVARKLSSPDTRCSYIKRATSLSSLHNLNQTQIQSQQQQHYNHPRNYRGQSDTSNPSAFSNNDELNGSKRAGANYLCHRRAVKSFQKQSVTCRPESNSNYAPSRQSAKRDLEMQQYARNHQHSQFKSPPPPPPERQQSQPSNNQQLSKKTYKYKQVATKNSRYKSKLHNQQGSPQQQGCPVLPPLPRSQSLHELIQLRATENGQRMRTTGTLRGPLGDSEPAGKVNLVAELLESRRLQRLSNIDKEQIISVDKNSQTMMSQSSSTDDGIHDVSITGAEMQHSANEPRGKQLSSPASSSSNHGYSVSGQSESKNSVQRQRIFKKQPTEASRSSRFCQKPLKEEQQRQETKREQAPHDRRDSSQNYKSTLKRSLSHSALQQSCSNSNLDAYNQDGDESDDLNELARFLYQFKQRQLKGKSAKNETEPGFCAVNEVFNFNKNQDDQRRAPTSVLDQIDGNNFQQSPNSTTSSSGFASSTCTSHSISSTDGTNSKKRDEFESISSVSSRDYDSESRFGPVAKPTGRKKYPAPPRPDDIEHSVQSDFGKMKNCLISSKLKLSSSLLSIVDEYQSTLQSGDKSSPQTFLATSSSNLTSVLLMGKNPSNKTKMIQKRTASRVSDDEEDVQSQDGQLQSDHIERLRRYTRTRQISQSELALNHLTSSLERQQNSSPLPSSKFNLKYKHTEHVSNNLCNESKNNSKPRSSRIFNLIRRISDKMEINNNRSEQRSACDRFDASKSLSDATIGGCRGSFEKNGSHSVGGQFNHQRQDRRESDLDAINQSEPNSSHPDECGQKPCTASDSHADCMGRLAAGKANGPTDSNDQFYQPKPIGVVKNESAISGSLCDLNFDCDLELMKNCRSTDERSKLNNAKEAILNRQLAGKQNLLQQTKCDGNNKEALSGANKKKRKQNKSGQQQQLIMDSAEREHNWRLAAASSVIRPTNSRDLGSQDKRQHVLNHDNNNNNNNSIKRAMEVSSVDGHESLTEQSAGPHKVGCKGQDKPSRDQSQSQHQQPLPQHRHKSKWLASSWLLGGGNGKRKAESTSKGDDETRLAGKSYLSKLISSNGKPEPAKLDRDKSRCDTGSGNDCRRNELMSEADQLLVELDHSLDLVSRPRNKFANNMTVPWWQQVANEKGCASTVMEAAKRDDLGGDVSLNSDDDDEECDDCGSENDADYASISRAIINETFDVDLSKETEFLNDSMSAIIKPGSPSNSFTFSAPNSPIPDEQVFDRLRINLHSSANSEQNLKLNISHEGNHASQQGRNHNKQAQLSVMENGISMNLSCLQGEQQFSSVSINDASSGRLASLSKLTDSALCSASKEINCKLEVGRQKCDDMGKVNDNGSSRGHNLAETGGGTEQVGNNGKMKTDSSTFTKPHSKNLLVSVAEKQQRDIDTGETEAVACKEELGVNNRQDQNVPGKIVCNGDGRLKSQHFVTNHPVDLRDHSDGHVKCIKITSAAADEHHAMSKYHPHEANRFLQASIDHKDSDGVGCNALNEKNNLPRSIAPVDQTKKSIGDDQSDRYKQPKHLHALEQSKQLAVAGHHNNCDSCQRQKDFQKPITNVRCQGAAISDDRLIMDRSAEKRELQKVRRENSINHSVCSIHGQSTCCACCCASSNNKARRAYPATCNGSKQHQEHSGCNNDILSDNFSEAVKANGTVVSPQRTVHNDIKGNLRSYDMVARCTGCVKDSCENAPLHNGSCCRASLAAATTVDCYRNGQAIHSHETENDKLIIQKSSGQCCLSAAGYNQEQSGEKKLAVSGSRLESAQVLSTPDLLAVSDNLAGVVVQQQPQTEREVFRKIVDSKASPAVTYYHYSHELRKFAPTNGHQQADGLNDCALVGSERESQCRNQVQCPKAPKLNGCCSSECNPKDAIPRDSAVPSSAQNIKAEQRLKQPTYYNPSSEARHQHRNHAECQNEDVKLPKSSCCSHTDQSVSCSSAKKDCNGYLVGRRFEPLLDNRPRHEMDESERIVFKSESSDVLTRACCSSSQLPTTACHEVNCHCCASKLSVESARNHQSSSGQYSSSSSAVAHKTGPLPDGQVACLAKVQSHAMAHSNQHSETRCNPICRSNSELVMIQQGPGLANKSRPGTNDSGREKRIGNVLFGKLRSSLLNQKNSRPRYVASSQLSLLNCHDGPHLVQNMLVPAKRDKLSSVVANEFDENFILRRKTPNAGLKSRC